MAIHVILHQLDLGVVWFRVVTQPRDGQDPHLLVLWRPSEKRYEERRIVLVDLLNAMNPRDYAQGVAAEMMHSHKAIVAKEVDKVRPNGV